MTVPVEVPDGDVRRAPFVQDAVGDADRVEDADGGGDVHGAAAEVLHVHRYRVVSVARVEVGAGDVVRAGSILRDGPRRGAAVAPVDRRGEPGWCRGRVLVG